MAGVKGEQGTFSPEQLATKAAARERQEAIINGIYGDFKTESEQKRQKEKAALKMRALETSTGQIVRDPLTIYLDANQIITTIYNDLQGENEAKQTISSSDSNVRWIYTDEGESLLTIPDIGNQVKGAWESILYEYEEPDEIVSYANHLAVARGAINLNVALQRADVLGYAITMTDTYEHPLMRLRLSGHLIQRNFQDVGSMLIYEGNESAVHPAVKPQTEKSLSQLLTVFQEGHVRDIVYPQTSSR